MWYFIPGGQRLLSREGKRGCPSAGGRRRPPSCSQETSVPALGRQEHGAVGGKQAGLAKAGRKRKRPPGSQKGKGLPRIFNRLDFISGVVKELGLSVGISEGTEGGCSRRSLWPRSGRAIARDVDGGGQRSLVVRGRGLGPGSAEEAVRSRDGLVTFWSKG